MLAQTYNGYTAFQPAPSPRALAEALAERLFGIHAVAEVRLREQAGWRFCCYHLGTLQTISVTPPNSQREFLWRDILAPGEDQQAFCCAWGALIDRETITILEAAEMIVSNDQDIAGLIASSPVIPYD